jgi:hypothetical protein
VTGPSLNRLFGQYSGRSEVLGLHDPRTGETWLHATWVCEVLDTHMRTGRLSNWTVDALVIVGHEAAHARGIDNESKAECAGVKWAWWYMNRTHVFVKYDPNGVKAQLLDNSNRPAAYKLRGCWL